MSDYMHLLHLLSAALVRAADVPAILSPFEVWYVVGVIVYRELQRRGAARGV